MNKADKILLDVLGAVVIIFVTVFAYIGFSRVNDKHNYPKNVSKKIVQKEKREYPAIYVIKRYDSKIEYQESEKEAVKYRVKMARHYGYEGIKIYKYVYSDNFKKKHDAYVNVTVSGEFLNAWNDDLEEAEINLDWLNRDSKGWEIVGYDLVGEVSLDDVMETRSR